MASNILILNLTRMGDLIQTTPLIRGLRGKNPDCRITMLANAKFAGILKLVEGIDELVTLDLHQFGSKGGQEETDLLKVYEYIDSVASGLKAKKFDQLINLSHSKLSAAFSLLLNVPDGRGFLSTTRGSRLIKNPWLIYFTSFLAFRRLNRFNLVDMYIRGADIAPSPSTRLSIKPDEAAIAEVAGKMAELGIKDGDILVGMQAGASREDRRWSPKEFAKVGDRLAKNMNAKIVLFGAESEKKLAKDIESAMSAPVINLAGATNLPELVAWVKRVSLLVTNDTGTMHIAAALERPIVALFFVHARCEETGPYCGGAVILQADISCAPCSHQAFCDHYSCLEYITAADVATACESVLKNDPSLLQSPEVFKKVKLYRSSLKPYGGMDFIPVRKVALDMQELFAYLYEPLFVKALTEWETPERMENSAGLFDGAIKELGRRFSPPAKESFDKWISRAEEGAERFCAIARETERLTGVVETGKNAKDMSAAAEQLARFDAEIGTMAETHEGLSPLAYVYRRRLENFEGDDPRRLARQARLAAKWLENASSLFNHALKSVKSGIPFKEGR